MKTVEVKPTVLEHSKMYERAYYPDGIGFYECNKKILFVKPSFVLYICESEELSYFQGVDNKKTDSKTNLSEEFILKMMAIAVNKEKFKDLN